MVMYFQVGALSLTVVHGSPAGRPSDGDVLSSGCFVPYSGSRVASRTSFRWCCTFKWMRCPLQWFTGREPDILQMAMYFQVGALSLTVVHGSRAGHLDIFTADVQHEAPSVGRTAHVTQLSPCRRCVPSMSSNVYGGGRHGNHNDCMSRGWESWQPRRLYVCIKTGL